MVKITIDTERWITPKKYAQLTGLSQSAVTKIMAENRANTKIHPEIGVKLIERPGYAEKKPKK